MVLYEQSIREFPRKIYRSDRLFSGVEQYMRVQEPRILRTANNIYRIISITMLQPDDVSICCKKIVSKSEKIKIKKKEASL